MFSIIYFFPLILLLIFAIVYLILFFEATHLINELIN